MECKGDGSCGKKERGECDGGCAHDHFHAAIDVKSLGPEAVELAKMFEDVNNHLVGALKARRKILETLHKYASQSQEMKEKMDKVVESRHPVLIQFVFSRS